MLNQVAVILDRPEAKVAASDATQSEKLWAYAVCDGAADDVEIAGAIARVSAKVTLSHGTFDLRAKLAGKTGVTIAGQGSATVLQANTASFGGTDALRPLIAFVGVAHAGLRNLVIDGLGASRVAGKAIGQHALISNASHIVIDGVHFRGGGYTASSDPSGPYLALVSEAVSGDFAATLPAAAVGSVHHCAITRCTFEQSQATGGFAFAVRVLTDWTNKRDPDTGFGGNYVHSNTFAFNAFLDDGAGNAYSWNTLEFAGGGTRDNLVQGNHFQGRTLTHIDFDKGCNRNLATGNIIHSAGKPTAFLGDPTNVCAAINIHGTGDDYLSVGNSVVANHISDVVNASDADAYQCFIGVEYAKDTQIVNNQARNLNGGAIGRGVHLGYTTPGTTVARNKLRGVLNGVASNSQATSREGVTVQGNDIESAEQAIVFGGTTPGSGSAPRSVSIANNRIKVASASLPGIVAAPEISGVVIANNAIDGGQDGLYLNAVNVSAVGNILRSGANGVRLLQSGAMLTGNICYAATGLLLGSGIVPTLNSGNSWNKKMSDGTAAPTTGTWAVGDVVTNSAPAESGTAGSKYVVTSWVCVSGGSPGTWLDRRALTGN